MTPYDPKENIESYICKCLGAEIEHARFSGRINLDVTWGIKTRCLANTLISGDNEYTIRPTAPTS